MRAVMLCSFVLGIAAIWGCALLNRQSEEELATAAGVTAIILLSIFVTAVMETGRRRFR